MTFIRRLASAVFVAVLLVTSLRLSGSTTTPLQRGGWRPLTLPPGERAA